MTTAAPAAWDPEQPGPGAAPDPWAELAYQLEHGPRPPRADPMAGPWEVNASLFEQLAALGRTDPVRQHAERQRLAAFQHSIDAARLAGLPTFGLPARGIGWAPVSTSLDTRQQSRRQVPRPDEGTTARQRDRYKRAMADALDAFVADHAPRRTIAKRHETTYRPRWLDHRHDCRSPRCGGCGGIPARTAGRWHRRQLGRRRDYLVPAVMPVTDWLHDRASALRGCREAVALRDAACGGTLIIPQSCRVRTCPDCEAARQAKVVDRYTAAVEQLAPDRARFLTLTARNCHRGELAGAIAQLMANLERFKRRALWKGGRCRDRSRCRQAADPERPGWHLPHEPVTAAMTSIEVTYNAEAKTWHPHAHLVLEGPYQDQAELAETWEQLTGDSRIVWIESVRRHAADKWAGDVQGALRELLKYSAKPTPAYLSERDPGPIAELLVALRGRHLTTTAGKLHGMDADLEPDETEPLVLVWPADPRAEPYRAPATCPLHGAAAEWSVAGYVERHKARRTPARAGPRRAVLALPDATDVVPSAGDRPAS